MKTGLILASSSPRRSDLLRQIGAGFEILPTGADENLDNAADPAEHAATLAHRKASSVREHIINAANSSMTNNDRALIIGADTVVVTHGGAILGKPIDGPSAEKMLQSLSGGWHEVYTGVAIIELIYNAKEYKKDYAPLCNQHKQYLKHNHGGLVCCEMTRVKMRGLSAGDIDAYIKTGEPFGKAGAYAAQGAGALFIERVEGCYYNVVGLPLHLLHDMLMIMDYDILTQRQG